MLQETFLEKDLNNTKYYLFPKKEYDIILFAMQGQKNFCNSRSTSRDETLFEFCKSMNFV